MARVQYDLTVQNPLSSALVHSGYIFVNSPPYATPVSGTGSGNFNSFLRIQNDGNEEGYNTPSNPNTGIPTVDTKAGVSLLPNNLTLSGVGSDPSIGQNYYVFGLDAQESPGGGGNYFSIDELSISWSASDVATLPGYPTAAINPDNNAGNIALNNANDAAKLAFVRNNTTRIWSTDYKSDNSADDHTTKSFFAAVPVNANLYLLGRLGNAASFNGKIFTTESSFEEFGTVARLNITPPPVITPVPEAGTTVAVGCVALGIAGAMFRNRSSSRTSKS